jgi:hypothetical protein
MDEPTRPDLLPPHLDGTANAWRLDLRYLAILVLLAVGFRTWQLTHTEVTARDSISYIQTAWRFDHEDWRNVLRTSNHHPVYPVSIVAMSHVVRPFADDSVWAMQLSAQLVNAVASVLLVVPLYYLGRELFARHIAFWSVVLIQCLPSFGRVMPDGLTEPLFLLFAMASLALALRALRTHSWPTFALAGACSGLAYLTRPEGAIIGAATGLVLLVQQIWASTRRPWKPVLVGGVALAASALLFALPFMKLIGGITSKPSANYIIDNKSADDLGAPWVQPGERSEAPQAATAQLFAYWWARSDVVASGDPNGPRARRWWGARILLISVVSGLVYVGVLPALIGLWTYRDRLRLVPGTWVLVVLGTVLIGVLYLIAVYLAYMSDRHALLLILMLCYFAVAGLAVMGRWFAVILKRPQLAWTYAAVLLGLLCAGTAVKTLQPLHPERAGFREAGKWLAEHARPEDRLVDPYAWTTYYAGRVFEAPAGQSSTVCYVVVDETPNKASHVDDAVRAKQLAATGRQVKLWELKKGKVAIYEVTAH